MAPCLTCAYLPFGAGTRTCIGKSFALMEALLVLACVAQRYSFRHATASAVRRDAAVTLAPRGLRMIARERQRPRHPNELGTTTS